MAPVACSLLFLGEMLHRTMTGTSEVLCVLPEGFLCTARPLSGSIDDAPCRNRLGTIWNHLDPGGSYLLLVQVRAVAELDGATGSEPGAAVTP